MKEILNVEGITCDHCVKTVKEAIIKNSWSCKC